MSDHDLLLYLARKRLLQLMREASESNTACGWFVGREEATEMVRLADLLELSDEWWVNPLYPQP